MPLIPQKTWRIVSLHNFICHGNSLRRFVHSNLNLEGGGEFNEEYTFDKCFVVVFINTDS